MDNKEPEQTLQQYDEEEGNPDRKEEGYVRANQRHNNTRNDRDRGPRGDSMKSWIIVGLVLALGYTCVQLTKARLDLQRFSQGSRSYMLIQQAYNEGLADGCKEAADDVLVD